MIIKNYIFRDELINDMKLLSRNSTSNIIEYGFNLYSNLMNPFILERGNLCIGDYCDVTLHETSNKFDNKYSIIGSFHTHPYDLEKDPSYDISFGDMYNILDHKITCIGYSNDKMACYILNVINDKIYTNLLKHDDNIIKKYLKEHDFDEKITEEFKDTWERVFNYYITIYYINLNTQTIELENKTNYKLEKIKTQIKNTEYLNKKILNDYRKNYTDNKINEMPISDFVYEMSERFWTDTMSEDEFGYICNTIINGIKKSNRVNEGFLTDFNHFLKEASNKWKLKLSINI